MWYLLDLQALEVVSSGDGSGPLTLTSYVSTILCPASFGCAQFAATR
ncbi:hypothetical protein [Virgisporangium aurantiacum]|uniref:Uncharacterized protein n=1 Tax=Virgisporangium aurantiacum TaxID=175570 RepID=A0A8J4E9P7_9ACTN|nr:hypothetical protein [Virgisporangium aurantiacum]GIJ63957.1 hypothetical protein Vau01_114730 [Virgisporangium aurantiacum]